MTEYRQEDFQQELSGILATLTPNTNPGQISAIFRDAGRCIFKAKEYLPSDLFWSVIDRVGMTRIDAWECVNLFKASAQGHVQMKPLEAELQEVTQQMHNIEAMGFSPEKAIERLEQLFHQSLQVARSLDAVSSPLQATLPSHQQMMLELLKEHLQNSSEDE